MKKLLALAGIALIAAACTNNDEPVQECGQINLTLENGCEGLQHTSPSKRQCEIRVNQLSDL